MAYDSVFKNEPYLTTTCCVCGQEINLAHDQWTESPGGEYMHVSCMREYQKEVDRINRLSIDEFIDVVNKAKKNGDF